MTNSELILALAALCGPVIAVGITLWHQRRKEKRDNKLRLFGSLMAHRRSNPPSADWVGALNLIDVVFSDNPKVLTAWHQLYDCLGEKPWDQKKYEHRTLDLLSEIATILGYKNLKQTDIDKFYSPIAHGEAFQLSDKLQREMLRVLESTESIAVVPRKSPPRSDGNG